MKEDPATVTVRLSADSATVLLSLASRVEDDPIEIRHPGELAALWQLEAALERTLVVPFHKDYEQKLADALERLRTKAGL